MPINRPPNANLPLSTITGKQLLSVFAIGGLGLLALFFTSAWLVRTRLFDSIDSALLDLGFGLLAYGIFAVASWLVIARRSRVDWAHIGIRHCDPSLFWIGGFLAFLWIGISSAIYAAAGIWDIAIAEGGKLIAPFRGDTIALAGLFLIAGPVAAFVEEILFRGIIYGWLRRRLGIAAAAVLSALIFTSVHFYVFVAGFAAALEMTVLAVLLALLFEVSRSLWPSILCHALNNMLLLLVYLYRG
jgi:membrane protease YdiL (CAAX protease family)